MKIIAAQINPTIGALKANTNKILTSIEQSKRQGVDLVVFSELAICGYPPQDLLFHQSFIAEMEGCLETILQASQGITVLVGIARRNVTKGERNLFNSVAVLHHGKLLGFQDKWLLPMYDVFNERRYFEPGREMKLWDINGVKIGITICEDIWPTDGYVDATYYDRDPVEILAKLKPDIMLNASASPYQMHKVDRRLHIYRKAAQKLKCPAVFCCQVGANDQIVFDGHSAYVDHKGVICKVAKGFQEDMLCIDTHAAMEPQEFSEDVIGNLCEALKTGIRDYCHKLKFKTACLGVSGGIDSALVAYLAKEALGKDQVLAVWMPSMYSSEESKEDAFELCNNLGIRCVTLPIKEPFYSILEVLTPEFKDKNIGVTEENLQARIRGVMLMALSNKDGHLVLSTGNKSELALGYCTLYGDMCGGLGVIGDVLKTQVYELACYINKQAKQDIIPQRIIDKPPSAELKPGQKDLDSLPEYGIVDHVLQGYVEDYLTAEVISKKYGISMDIIEDLIHRMYQAEYKRRQGAPTIRISKKSFGVGRQYPIVQNFKLTSRSS
jgi:NAD+ synthase (glutamine-hydrolysing)